MTTINPKVFQENSAAGRWRVDLGDGAIVSAANEQEARTMASKQTVINQTRQDFTAFVQAARKLRVDMEDLNLLGLMPGGDQALTDADFANGDISLPAFLAGVEAFIALNPTPSPEQSAALARVCAR